MENENIEKNPLDIAAKLTSTTRWGFNPLNIKEFIERAKAEGDFENSIEERNFINIILAEVIGVDEHYHDELKELAEALKKVGCDKYLESTNKEIAERCGYIPSSYEEIANDNTLYPGILYIRTLMSADPVEVSYANDRMGKYMPAYLRRSKQIGSVQKAKSNFEKQKKEVEDIERKIAELTKQLEEKKSVLNTEGKKLKEKEDKLNSL